MLVLNGTKDFATLMKTQVSEPPTKSIALDPAGDMQWVCHAVKLKRKNCIIAMEAETRYGMIFIDVKKAHAAQFPQHFIKRLATEMSLMHDHPMQQFESSMQALREHHPSVLICKRPHRSVQSHINDVVWHLKNYVEKTGALPENNKEIIDFGVFINRLLRSTKEHPDFFQPYERIQEQWLQWFPELASVPFSEPGIAKIMDKKFTQKISMAYTKQTLH